MLSLNLVCMNTPLFGTSDRGHLDRGPWSALPSSMPLLSLLQGEPLLLLLAWQRLPASLPPRCLPAPLSSQQLRSSSTIVVAFADVSASE